MFLWLFLILLIIWHVNINPIKNIIDSLLLDRINLVFLVTVLPSSPSSQLPVLTTLCVHLFTNNAPFFSFFEFSGESVRILKLSDSLFEFSLFRRSENLAEILLFDNLLIIHLNFPMNIIITRCPFISNDLLILILI